MRTQLLAVSLCTIIPIAVGLLSNLLHGELSKRRLKGFGISALRVDEIPASE
jgi:hypothetical protein